ncbi:hypothetical protein WKH56_09065 [Priestia sp. SB1]|uniref:hypothetical protein n=1 Tax=Priestia sp. SB1 TaxID=3132359 RepID=UPI0031728408
MKKPVLIGASLVLATSILGACGKESSTANAENQKITQSQVADITLNGERLSNKKIKEYREEYMQAGKYVGMNKDTQAVIKHMILKDGMMKDLGVTQKDIDNIYEKAVKDGAPSVKLDGKKVVAKGVVLEMVFEDAYGKKYLSTSSTTDSLAKKKMTKEDEKGFKNHISTMKEDHPIGDYSYVYLFYLAQKYDLMDTDKYQQDLLNKADIKGVKLPKLKTDEIIF